MSGYRELDRAPRKFLLFGFFNVVSWQCVVGPAMILFARHIHMPSSWVGFLIAFMPLSMLLILVMIRLVTRVGPKRLMFAAWLLRNLTMCSVFLMPWAMRRWGPHAAWYVLIGATLGFCIIRAVGAGGWFPWLHELLPEKQRGTYFSTEAALIQSVMVGVMVLQAIVLARAASVDRFLIVYGIGIGAGLLSLARMARIPGGRGVPHAITLRESFAFYRQALADRPFRYYVLTAALCFSCVSWFAASIVLYMRDILGMPSGTIMLFMAAGSTGIFFTIRFWGRFADHSGSGQTMFLTLAGHSVAAFVMLALIPGAPWTPYALILALVPAFVLNAAFCTAAHRAMLNYVKASARVGYTNLYMSGISLAQGVTPILVGFIVEHLHLWGFRLCFAISGFAGVTCAVACRWVVADATPIERFLSRVMNPVLPVRTLARIAWITAGMHKSSREAQTNT